MDADDAARLIAPAVGVGERWADLGAGTGTFTAALARLLGPTGEVYALERDARAMQSLETLAAEHRTDIAPIVVMPGDFTKPLELASLDGALLANALHFVDARNQSTVVARVASTLTLAGSIVIVEYENRSPTKWVPFPVSPSRLVEIARAADLGAPEIIGRRPSDYGGVMFAARITRR